MAAEALRHTSLKTGLDASGDASHLFVGFPLTSADKFMPEGTEAVKSADGTPEAWVLPATQFPPEEEYARLDGDMTVHAIRALRF